LCLALPDAINKTERQKCSCPTHYTLDANNQTCSPPESFILFSQKTEISRLIVDDENTDTAPDVVLPIQNVRNPKAIDYDEKKGHLYWISGKSKSIKRSKLDGSEVSTANYFPTIFLVLS
jgi:low density lipoprotein receptor-related protein 5/6